MVQRSRAQRLNGLFPLSYTGVVPVSPVNFVMDGRAPTVNDSKNFYIGDMWLDISTQPPTTRNLWVLTSLVGNLATWDNFGSGDLETLTGNSGGPVFPLGNNINVVGDGTTISVVGNPATHTLTISAIAGAGLVETLTGNSGGAVGPTAGNINVVGTGVITVVGNPGTSTLTVTPSGAIASSFITNPATGTAVPVAGVLTFAGASGITVSAAGSTVTITGSGAGATSFPTDSGTATPAAGVLNIITGLASNLAGSSVFFHAPGASNTVELNVTDSSFNTLVGNAAGNLTLSGSLNTGFGDSVLNALTTGSQNTVVGAVSGSSITTGSGNVIIGQGAGNNLTSSEAGNILINDPGVTGINNFFAVHIPNGGAGFQGFDMHNYPGGSSVNGSNLFIGQQAGNRTMTAPAWFGNIGIGDSAISALTTGPHNVCIGVVSGLYVTSGDGNTFIGHGSGSNIGAGNGVTTGSRNVAIGYTAGTDWRTSDTNNIAIGQGTGVIGDNNTMRLGAKSGLGFNTTRAFMEGVRGVTTGNADAVAVLIDSAGQLGTVSSSMRYKSNIEPMGSVSDRLMNLEPVTFSWKKDQDYTQQLGLIAEEVEAVFPELVAYDQQGIPESVKYHELPVLLLNELKKLAARVAELESHLK